MDIVTIHTAKTTLSQLLARVEAGEEIVLARGKVPIARLVPYQPATPKRQFGALRTSSRSIRRFSTLSRTTNSRPGTSRVTCCSTRTRC
jgi:prevent-host-death family protein